MFKTIFRKEILDNLLNLRFQAGFALCVILTLAGVAILTHDYRRELEDYHLRLSLQDSFLEKYAHTNRIGGLITPQQPPETFRPFVIGLSRESEAATFTDNPLQEVFPPLDLVFIVTVILSLMAVMFSYDAISGERESGTLKLIAGSSVPRWIVLLAKWAGGMVSLLIPFLFAALAGGLYLALQPDLGWRGDTWLAFLVLLGAAALYLSLFYLLGLLVSARCRYSVVSVLSSLFLWVLLTLVLPSLSPYLAAQFQQVPSVSRVEKEVFRLTQVERDELIRQLEKEPLRELEQRNGEAYALYQTLDRGELRRRVETDPALRALHEQVEAIRQRAVEEANQTQKEKAGKLQADLNLKAERQVRLARNLACISPYADFVYVATDLTGTGLRSRAHFEQLAGQFYGDTWKYLGEQSGRAREADPTFNENAFLDVHDRPRFVFTEEPLRQRLEAVLPFLGVLLGFNVLLFAGGLVAFARYDVR